MLSVGLSVPGALTIPPYQDNWITEGYCAEECTAEVCVLELFIFIYIFIVNNVIAAALKQQSSMAAV